MGIFYGVVVAASLWAGEYSPLRQVNTGNVRRLQVVWTYRTGEPLTALPGGGRAPAFEATAVYSHGLLYVSSPFGEVVALEPDSGKVRWERQIAIDRNGNYGDFASRCVSVWKDRIFVATIDAQLVALDALTGAPSAGFVSPDLTKGLRELRMPGDLKGKMSVSTFKKGAGRIAASESGVRKVQTVAR